MLLDRAYGELAPGPAREVEAHLADCASCRAEAARIEETRGLYRRLGEEPAPGGEGILLAAARQAAGAGGTRRPGFLAWPRLAIGVALVLVVGGVSVKLLSVRRERTEEEVVAAGEPRTPPAAPERPPAAAGAERAAAPAEVAAAPRPAASPMQSPAAAPRPPEPRVAAKSAARSAPAEAASGRERLAAADQAAPPEAARSSSAAGGGAADAQAFADSLVRDLRRRRDAGELNQAHRELDPCPGGDRARVAWLDGWGKAWRLSRTAPLPAGMGEGEATRDQYYDGAGRLRVALVDGTGPAGHFRRRIVLDEAGHRLAEDPPGSPWPEGDLVLRGAAAAFWAPQRCGR
jgi:hypothetical protein